MKKELSLILMLSFSGCMTDLEQRIKKLESSMNDMRSFQAEQTTQISYLQGEMRKLTGKTEEIEYTQNQRYGTDLNSLKEDLSTLKRRVPPPANVPMIPLEEDEALSENSGLADFSNALLTIREGKYRDALPILQGILQTGPADAAPHVLFWVGVCYDGLSEYKSALATYHDLTTQFPKHKRAPLALLREVSVFEKIGDGKAAAITTEQLLQSYPNSPEAMQMKSRSAAKVPPAPVSSTKKKK